MAIQQEDLDTQVCHRGDVDPDIIENEALNKNMNNVIYDNSEEEDDTLNEYYSEDEKSLDGEDDNADSDIGKYNESCSFFA